MDGASYFDPGEPAREVALILLEATALPRRLAASRAWPSTLPPHEWQVLLAIALGNAQVAPEGAQTPRGIASALALQGCDRGRPDRGLRWASHRVAAWAPSTLR